MLNRIKHLGKIKKDTDSNFPLIKSLSDFIYHLYNSMGSGMILSETELLIVKNSNFSNFSSIFVKDRFQAVKNINNSFSFLGVFNSLNEDDIKSPETTLAEIYSNQSMVT